MVGLIAPSISGERKFAGVVGGFCSGVVVTLAPLLNSFSLSFVGGMQGSPELSDRSLFPNFIRLSPSDAAFAEAVAALDDAGFRESLAGCCPGIAQLKSSELLTWFQRQAEISEMVHNFNAAPPKPRSPPMTSR